MPKLKFTSQDMVTLPDSNIPPHTSNDMVQRYMRAPLWWQQKRYPWLTPWWLTQTTPPPLTPEQMDPNRDFCREQMGFSQTLLGRRIFIRAPRIPVLNGIEGTEELEEFITRTTRKGLVLQVGIHAYPDSDVFGTIPFVCPGDWVVFSQWEKAESINDKCFFVNDLHILSVIDPQDYPTLLQGEE